MAGGRRPESTNSVTRRRGNGERRCANCWVCRRDSEFCPRSERYDQEACERWLEAVNASLRRQEKEQDK